MYRVVRIFSHLPQYPTGPPYKRMAGTTENRPKYASPRIQLRLQRPFRAELFSYRPPITVNGGKPNVDLTDDAVPSQFSYGPQTKKLRLSSERRFERERHQEVSALLFQSLL